MRLVLTEHLKEGDIIAKDIISYEGGILLCHNTRFREVFRDKLIERNILEVYIEDEVSKGIEPNRILEPSAKQKITQDVQLQFYNLQNDLALDSEGLSNIANFLIEQLSQKELILELEDLKVNDQYTYEHCIAVALLTEVVCDKLNINLEQKAQIVMGALIHDIGKIIIPKDILNKPSCLTNREYETIKDHAELGYMMIKEDRTLSAITKLIVLCHHEREDGSGYPLGKGKELHIGAKIVAACDVFHALISDRCYRQGLPIEEVIDIVKKEAINPEIREIIEHSFACYPVGAMVCLNDGNIAIVEQNFATDIKRPIVRVLKREKGKIIQTCTINLKTQREYYITGRYYNEI